MEVTCFKNIFDTTEPMFVDVVEILRRIKDGNSKAVIEKIRQTKKGEKEYDDLKKRLPSVCFSGKFSKREAQSLLQHSGLICLDIDELKEDDVKGIREVFENDKHTFACFVSPGGLGVKVLVQITNSIKYHKPHFLALEQHFNQKIKKFTSTKANLKLDRKTKIDPDQGDLLAVCLDKSGKDVNRVCYESFDPNCYFNQDSEIWDDVVEHVEYQKEVDDYDLIIKKLQIWIDHKMVYTEGARNQFLYQFSCALCRYSVGEMRTLDYLASKYPDYPPGELRTTVKGAYKASDFGSASFTEIEKKKKFTNIKIETKQPITSFWTVSDKGKFDIDAKQFLKFIEANGFGIYRQNASDEKWLFVKITNMIVDIVTVIDIKINILNFVEEHAPTPVFDLLQNKNRYFEKTYLNALPIIDVQQIRDKPDSSYIFFEKFYYEISKEGSFQKDYIDLEGRHIWRQQICKREIKQVRDYKDFSFFKFVKNAVGGNENKLRAALTSLGYVMHTFKKKRLAKLIYACDDSIDELDGMAAGGSGKNVYFECLKYVRSVGLVDGKVFDKSDKFAFQTISEHTQVIMIDDYEGDTKELFTKVTGHFELEKKGMDKTILEFEEAPKIIVNSNTSPKGFSDSFARRMQMITFSDHYNVDHTIADDFGDLDFFSNDWNQEDWDMLYSMLFDCCKVYHTKGLIAAEVDNSKSIYKTLVKNVGPEFTAYFIDYDFNEFTNGLSLWKQFVDQTKVDLKSQTFWGHLRRFAGIKKLKYEEDGRGEYRLFRIISKNGPLD